jgi:hypothetical protein
MVYICVSIRTGLPSLADFVLSILGPVQLMHPIHPVVCSSMTKYSCPKYADSSSNRWNFPGYAMRFLVDHPTAADPVC